MPTPKPTKQPELRPGTVAIVGTTPPNQGRTTAVRVILAVLWIGCAISALSGENGWAVFLGVVAGIGTLVHLLSVCAIQNLKGKPLVIAGPEGLWTTQFALPWSNVRAFEFIEKPATHNGGDPRLTTAARYVCESLLVTSNEIDASGRPQQYGCTLYRHHSGNRDELKSAAKRYAPDVEFWSTLDTTDYQLDPGAQAELDRQWAENGRIAVTTGRGKEKIVIDTDGITAAGDFAPWSAIAGLTAVTDVQSTMSPGMTFTDRAHRLVVVTNEVDRKGQRRTLRPEYSAGLRPPLEQLLPAIRRIAPDLPINDQRTGG